MDFYRQQLAAVEQKIEDLIMEQTPLKEKDLQGTISGEEEIALAGIDALLAFARRNRNDYRELISLALINEAPESRSFSEASSGWVEQVTGVNISSYREWTGYVFDETVQPRPGFKKAFEEVGQAFHQMQEAGRRVFLNLFLSDVILRPEFDESLRIFPELEVSVIETIGSERRRLYGTTDYMIGYAKGIDMFENTLPKEVNVVAVLAKTSIGEDDLRDCVIQAASLYKTRVDADKASKCVWGIVTTGQIWEFIFIDGDGYLWQSKYFPVNLRSYDEAKVLQVYRFIHYIVKCSYEASTSPPSASS